MGIVKILTKSEYLGFFDMGVFACPIDINPLAALTKHYKRDMRKQWRSCKKSDAVYCVVSIRECEFEKLLRDTPGLKMNFLPTPM
jgi:hypothetical protein